MTAPRRPFLRLGARVGRRGGGRGARMLDAHQELEPQLQAEAGASDTVQETFLKAHRHLDRCHGTTEAELLAWLRRLLLNNRPQFRRLYLDAAKRQAGKEVAL